MRGAQGEFGAPGPTLPKAGGEIFNSGTGTWTCRAREAEPWGSSWRTGGEGRETWGGGGGEMGILARYLGSPGGAQLQAARGPGSGGLMFNWSSGRPAVPSPAPGGAAGVGGVGCHSCSITPLPGFAATPVPAGPPGLPAAASCWKWRGWRD